MQSYAIMRCKKISNMGALAGSLKHCYRERETLNADPERTGQNLHLAAKSTDEAMGKVKELLPEKRRKDAVVAVEYMMGASPEWWKTASQAQQNEFFKKSLEWLSDKYGKQNIVTASIHRDETSPHLSAFVVPLTKDGRLSAKEYVGNRQKLTQDQTNFAERVADLGLERGTERSKAHHTTIKEYYARTHAPAEKSPNIDLPEPKLLERNKAYGKRAVEAALQQVAPELLALRAQASETAQVKREAKAVKEAHRDDQKRLKPLLDALLPLNPENQKKLLAGARHLLEQQRQKAPEVTKTREAEQKRPTDRGVER